MSRRTPRQFHTHGQRPASADSIQVPADVVARFLGRLQPAGGGCQTLRRLSVGRPRTAIRPKTYANIVWTDDDGRVHQVKAHRLALLLRIGPIPAGLFACHRCDHPACVAGSHLYAGSFADNAADRMRSRREQVRGATPSLHPTRYRSRAAMACHEVRPG